MKKIAASSASFLPGQPHTHADTRTEEARVGKQIVSASIGKGTQSTRREQGAR
jgi:hypothetical protein